MAEQIKKRLQDHPVFKDKRFWVVLAVTLLVALTAGTKAFLFFRTHVSTDDAFIEGDVITISPRVKGHIQKVYVAENQTVQAGDPLIEIDQRDYIAKVEVARAQLQAAKAEAKQAHQDLERYQQLTVNDEISKQRLDEAGMRADVADAGALKAAALLKQAELDLSYTRIAAPCSGRVTRKSAEVGTYVQAGEALMAIVPPERWVTANLKETQLTHVHPGQPATIKVDAYPGLVLKGHVDSIQRGTGARFSLLPPENATGSYVKVVQRVPVKIVLDEAPDPAQPLALGMSVVPTIKTK